MTSRPTDQNGQCYGRWNFSFVKIVLRFFFWERKNKNGSVCKIKQSYWEPPKSYYPKPMVITMLLSLGGFNFFNIERHVFLSFILVSKNWYGKTKGWNTDRRKCSFIDYSQIHAFRQQRQQHDNRKQREHMWRCMASGFIQNVEHIFKIRVE